MNKTVVVYKSKYGTTQSYAKWISEKLSCDIFEVSSINIASLKEYDTIIYGGGLYAGGVLGFNFIKKNYEALKNKKMILFMVGLTNPRNTEQFSELIDKALSKDMKENVKIFHLRGGMDYKKLKTVDKGLMSLLRKSVLKKKSEELDEDDKLMLETYGKKVDFVDEGMIDPIVDYVKEK